MSKWVSRLNETYKITGTLAGQGGECSPLISQWDFVVYSLLIIFFPQQIDSVIAQKINWCNKRTKMFLKRWTNLSVFLKLWRARKSWRETPYVVQVSLDDKSPWRQLSLLINWKGSFSFLCLFPYPWRHPIHEILLNFFLLNPSYSNIYLFCLFCFLFAFWCLFGFGVLEQDLTMYPCRLWILMVHSPLLLIDLQVCATVHDLQHLWCAEILIDIELDDES